MKDCANCSKTGVYNADPVPYVVHENMRAQLDVANRRLVRVIALLIVMLVGTNVFWALIK